MKPTLKLFTPINRGRKFIANITNDAIGWRRSVRAIGGYWMGGFMMESKTQFFGGSGGSGKLIDNFYNWLGAEIVEESGGFMTWQGLVYSMDLTYKGLIRRRSLDLMSNYVTVEYLDDEGENHFTTAAENTDSSGHFGRREALLTYDGIGSTAADAFRDRYLLENAYPYPRVVGADPTVQLSRKDKQITTLEVNCCGYIFTGNWKFETAGDGSQDDLSDYITDIINTDMEFIEVGAIATNTIQVYKDTPGQRRAWDVVEGLVGLGDTSGNPYSFMVGNNRLAYYKQISTSPKYFLRDGKIYPSPTGNNPTNIWMARPAVVRDMDYPVTRYWSGGWLNNIRDFYVYEFDAGMDSGLNVKTDLFDESELLLSLASYLKRNEAEHESEND